MQLKPKAHEQFQKENRSYLSIIFLSSVVFTLLGYILDMPREISIKEYLLVVVYLVFIALALTFSLLFLFKKVALAKAFSVIALGQIIASFITVLYQLQHNTLVEHGYAIEMIVQMIFMAIVGFLVTPRFVLFYATLAFITHLLLFIYPEQTGQFEFLYVYTITIVGFAFAMYSFSGNSIKAFTRIRDLALEVEDRNQRISQLNHFKTDLFSMIVHDIKSPLNLIISKTNHTEVREAARRIDHMVHNILDIEKYDNASLDLKVDYFSINVIIEKVLNYLEYAIHSKNIKLNYAPQLNYQTQGDEAIILRAIENILANAIRHTPLNHSISIEIAQVDQSKLQIGIFNDGALIPEGNLKEIFNKFSQVNGVNSQNNSGLGLTFCKLAIDAHHEKIWCENSGANEVAFFFTLPNISTQELKKNEAKALQSLGLTEEDKQKLAAVCREISQLSVHEASQIIARLSLLPESKTPAIRAWEEQVRKAVYSANSQFLQQLLLLAKV